MSDREVPIRFIRFNDHHKEVEVEHLPDWRDKDAIQKLQRVVQAVETSGGKQFGRVNIILPGGMYYDENRDFMPIMVKDNDLFISQRFLVKDNPSEAELRFAVLHEDGHRQSGEALAQAIIQHVGHMVILMGVLRHEYNKDAEGMEQEWKAASITHPLRTLKSAQKTISEAVKTFEKCNLVNTSKEQLAHKLSTESGFADNVYSEIEGIVKFLEPLQLECLAEMLPKSCKEQFSAIISSGGLEDSVKFFMERLREPETKPSKDTELGKSLKPVFATLSEYSDKILARVTPNFYGAHEYRADEYAIKREKAMDGARLCMERFPEARQLSREHQYPSHAMRLARMQAIHNGSFKTL